MKRSKISIGLSDEKLAYRPGDVLVGQYSIDAVGEDKVVAIESSVIWITEGKGEEDMGVHFFDRQKGPFDSRQVRKPTKFSTVLPGSPFSYDGMMVRVRWAIRVRVFFEVQPDCTEELYFRLGNVSSVLGDLSG